MNDENEPTTQHKGGGARRFLTTFFVDVARDLFKLVISFAIGTGGGAIVCWYYGIPLALSILGGILVLGFALALTSDTWFD